MQNNYYVQIKVYCQFYKTQYRDNIRQDLVRSNEFISWLRAVEQICGCHLKISLPVCTEQPLKAGSLKGHVYNSTFNICYYCNVRQCAVFRHLPLAKALYLSTKPQGNDFN